MPVVYANHYRGNSGLKLIINYLSFILALGDADAMATVSIGSNDLHTVQPLGIDKY